MSLRERLLTILIRGLPAWLILCGLLTIVAPNLGGALGRLVPWDGFVDEHYLDGRIAPLFTPEVDYWAEDIRRWAQTYGVDPNLVATVIQIESCGDPRAVSTAGASGLMQVMPQHFGAGEDPHDPETNMMRGLQILTECLYSPYNPQHDVGLALACYNAGPRIFVNAFESWPQQSRYYYVWGTGVYADAVAGLAASETLAQWLGAGGELLCAGARESLGLSPEP